MTLPVFGTSCPSKKRQYHIAVSPEFGFSPVSQVARSGNKPEYQNKRETVKYVEIANTSQTEVSWSSPKAVRVCLDKGIQRTPSIHAPCAKPGIVRHTLPQRSSWLQLHRFTPVRQPWRNSNRIAEIKRTGVTIPTHHMKLVISQPHPIVLFRFHYLYHRLPFVNTVHTKQQHHATEIKTEYHKREGAASYSGRWYLPLPGGNLCYHQQVVPFNCDSYLSNDISEI